MDNSDGGQAGVMAGAGRSEMTPVLLRSLGLKSDRLDRVNGCFRPEAARAFYGIPGTVWPPGQSSVGTQVKDVPQGG